MSIEIEQLIPSGGTLFLTIVSLIGMWFKFQNKVENLERDLLKDQLEDKEKFDHEMTRIKEINNLQWSKIDEIFKWQASHEKEAWENRNALELKIAALHGADEKLQTMLESIEKKLDELINRFEK